MKLYKIRRKKMDNKKVFYITIPTELARKWLDHGAYVEITPLQDNPLAAIVRVVRYEELPKVMGKE